MTKLFLGSALTLATVSIVATLFILNSQKTTKEVVERDKIVAEKQFDTIASTVYATHLSNANTKKEKEIFENALNTSLKNVENSDKKLKEQEIKVQKLKKEEENSLEDLKEVISSSQANSQELAKKYK